jgi:AcrR family transcriptional regulator
MAPQDERKKGEETPYHHGDLRNALVRAGLQILRSDGAQNLSLREAARAAGVSQAAPYRHFKNKEALLAAIAHEGFMMLGDQIRQATQIYRSNAEELFHQTALTYLRMAVDHADHFRLMFAGIPPLSAESHPELDRAEQGLLTEIVNVVQRCQKERVLRQGNTEQIALVAWCAFHGFSALLINQKLRLLEIPHPQTELAMRALTRNLLDGLRVT